MNAPLDIITEAVLRELAHAMAKYPTWPTDPLHAVAVLGEEFGELTKAVLQHTYEPHKADRVHVRLEAIQTAAMAIRFALSLDGYVYAPGEQHAQELHLGAADQPQSRTDAPCGSNAEHPSTVEGSEDRPLSFSEVELPPLPDTWTREQTAGMVIFRPANDSILTTLVAHESRIYLTTVFFDVDVADLITVLRHAEREHLRLKAGGER